MRYKNIDKKRIAAGAALAVVLLGAAVGLLAAQNRSKSHFAAGTVVNGMNVSGMTLQSLDRRIGSYSLKVIQKKANGSVFTEEISGKEFSVSIGTNDGAVQDILRKQTVWQYIFGRGKKYTVKNWFIYDEKKLEQQIEALSCFQEEQVTQPQNAYISDYDKEKGAYEIIEEQDGNAVDTEKAQKVIRAAVAALDTKVHLEKQGCYRKAETDSEDEALQEVLGQLNRYVEAKITYRFGENEEIVDGELISQWLKVTKKNRVVLRKQKLTEYVAGLRKKYDTIFRSRKFRTSYGKTVTVEGGDYGWWMNYQKEESELYKLIKNGKVCERTPEYFQTAQTYGKKDYGDSYVEINLAEQRVFLYIKGRKVLETDCVTGNAARGFDTPEGTYSITYKERNATLNGENYSTPVKYWMPFNKNIGLHDAAWRSSFGGELYKQNGSHGCVNLPPEKAKKLFRYVEAGMPVICYKYQLPKSTDKKVKTESRKSTVAKKNTHRNGE